MQLSYNYLIYNYRMRQWFVARCELQPVVPEYGIYLCAMPLAAYSNR
jgi:hypothetical protein